MQLQKGDKTDDEAFMDTLKALKQEKAEQLRSPRMNRPE